MAQEKARPTRARTKKDEAAETKPAPKPRGRRKTPVNAPMEVATLAYLFWEQGEPGDAMEHWLRAEREIAA
jgi:hypothetical protein